MAEEALTLKRSKYPAKYNIAAIIIYLISLEMANLMKEIKAKSPEASKQLPEGSIFIPEQLEEARKHFTGFVKQAIAVTAKRQTALNLAETKLQQLRNLISEMEAGFVLALQNPSFISEEGRKRLEETLKSLKRQETDILETDLALRKRAVAINDLLGKHSGEWQQHQQKYITGLIEELEKKGFMLSELEKKDLLESAKTIEEIKRNLRKQNIIK